MYKTRDFEGKAGISVYILQDMVLMKKIVVHRISNEDDR